MPHLRSFRPGDEPALEAICLATADAGGDAAGMLTDDDLWAQLFLSPYLARHPDLALVVETDDGRLAGYLVGTDDTDSFEDWFAREWWPSQRARWPRPAGESTSRQDELLRDADARGAEASPHAQAYPAHLHIDLLPELQGQGWGRRLIETYLGLLRARGVAGVHLAADPSNTGALAFYPRVGFTRLPTDEDSAVFGRFS